MKFNPNVKNYTLGIQGNWEAPEAYVNQKTIVGGIIYEQGTAAKAALVAKQMDKKLNLAPPKAPVAKRTASSSPNRAIVAKNAPVAKQAIKKPLLKAGIGATKVPLKKTNSNMPKPALMQF